MSWIIFLLLSYINKHAHKNILVKNINMNGKLLHNFNFILTWMILSNWRQLFFSSVYLFYYETNFHSEYELDLQRFSTILQRTRYINHWCKILFTGHFCLEYSLAQIDVFTQWRNICCLRAKLKASAGHIWRPANGVL